LSSSDGGRHSLAKMLVLCLLTAFSASARADLVLLDAPSHAYLARRPGVPLRAGVWQAGQRVR
jgi:hypothetical protein